MRYLIVLSICFGVFLDGGCGTSSAPPTNDVKTEVINANPANNSAVIPYSPANGGLNANAANSNANVVVVKPAGNAKPLTYTAPDDSDYATTMDAKGEAVETRTFHSNKYIAKVVRITRSASDKSISIYLKNGKMVNVPGDKWLDIKSQPVENFYAAAGIDPSSGGQTKPAGGKIVEKTKPPEKQ
jgi:hypothetical protein